MAIYDVGDKLELFWPATGLWEQVNYRGPTDNNRSVIVKNGEQIVVGTSELRVMEVSEDDKIYNQFATERSSIQGEIDRLNRKLDYCVTKYVAYTRPC